MVNWVGIYGFCLFKKKNVVEADGSINTNMYGLKTHERMLNCNGLRENKFQKKKGPVA